MRHFQRRNHKSSERTAETSNSSASTEINTTQIDLTDCYKSYINGFLEGYPNCTPSDALTSAISKAVPVLDLFLKKFNPKTATKEQHRFLKELYGSISLDVLKMFDLSFTHSLGPERLAKILRSSIDDKDMPRGTSFKERKLIRTNARNAIIITLGELAHKELSKSLHKEFKTNLDQAEKTRSILGSENLILCDNLVSSTHAIAAVRFAHHQSQQQAVLRDNPNVQMRSKRPHLIEIDQIAQHFRKSFEVEFTDNLNNDIRQAILERALSYTVELLYLSTNYSGNTINQLTNLRGDGKLKVHDLQKPELLLTLYEAARESDPLTSLIDSTLDKYKSISLNHEFADQVWIYLKDSMPVKDISLYARSKLALQMNLINRASKQETNSDSDYLTLTLELLGQLYDSGETTQAQRMFNKIESNNNLY